jgi:hypothetical protein
MALESPGKSITRLREFSANVWRTLGEKLRPPPTKLTLMSSISRLLPSTTRTIRENSPSARPT